MILSSSFLASSSGLMNWEEILKSLTQVKFRRADRFAHAVLSGALSCLRQHELKEFALYFGTSNGSVESVKNSHDNISQNQSPMPFTFINTLSSTPLFFLLQYLNMQTAAISIAHSCFAFENALSLSLVDLRQKRSKTAFIGVCDIWYEPLEEARKILDKNACEFSAWIGYEYNEKDCVKFFSAFDEVLDEAARFKTKLFYVSPALAQYEMDALEKIVKIRSNDTPKTITNYSAAVICAHFTKSNSPLFYIGYDSRCGYSFVNIN
ncbi:MAG: hypothetical protein LBP40_07565 [Campylobacteraceae bacterium]|jgi:hypothetical protein|nr:hypothetical protein [Campylobacteraceae bacterium]